MSVQNPYQAPITTDVKLPTESRSGRGYGGIGRLTYFLASFGFGISNNILQYFGIVNEIGPLVLASTVLGVIVSITLVVLRLKNLGQSGWWVLGFLVPILNLLIALRCIAAPEGYADHKTFDTAGKVIIGLIVGAFVLIILSVVLLSLTG